MSVCESVWCACNVCVMCVFVFFTMKMLLTLYALQTPGSLFNLHIYIYTQHQEHILNTISIHTCNIYVYECVCVREIDNIHQKREKVKCFDFCGASVYV